MLEENGPISFGAYSLLKRLARGDLAEVFLAAPIAAARAHERLVVKRLQPQFSGEPEQVARFLQEAKLAVQLAHPNIVRIHELGQHDGCVFMVMEHVDGRDLELLIRARRCWMQPAVAAFIGSKVCAALAYAHGAADLYGSPLGLVHGNVTSENVMVSRRGEVKLLDFGEARTNSNRHGAERGKVPSGFAGKEFDNRGDLFALGAVLYELTTGSKPQQKPASPTELDPAYPPELARVVMRALARDPDQGFGSAAEMQAALDQFLRPFGVEYTEQPLAALVQGEPAEKPSGESVHEAGDPDDEELGGRVETRIVALDDLGDDEEPGDSRVETRIVAVDDVGASGQLDDTGDHGDAETTGDHGDANEPGDSRVETKIVSVDTLGDLEDLGDSRVETRITVLPVTSEARATPRPKNASLADLGEQEETGPCSMPLLSVQAKRPDPQKRLVTPPLGQPVAAQPPRLSASRQGRQDWDDVTPAPRPAAKSPQPPVLVAPPARGKGARVFGAVLKGAALGALILGSAFVARVGTIAEIRLAATNGEQPDPAETASEESGDEAPAQEPPSADAVEPEAGAPLDAGATPELDGGIGDAGIAAAAPASTGGEASLDADTPDAGAVDEKGFGLIIVQGRGKLFIDGKPCRAPCAVRVAAGEHVIRGSGVRERKLTLEANAKEIVKVR